MDPLLKTGAVIVLAAVVAVAASSVGRRYGPVPAPYPTPAYSKALDAQIAADRAQLGPTAAKAAVDVAGIRLRSVGFEFPTEGRPLPPGPGLDVVSASCQSCHTPGMILTQPLLTRAEWTGEVNKMVNVYKAPVDKADIPVIVDYLVALKVGN